MNVLIEAVEEWRAVVGYEGYYEVSDHGRVRSLDRITRNRHGPCKRRGRILALLNHSEGYVAVGLSKLGKKELGVLVHILVAKAFLPRIPGKDQVNHKDFNRKNNNISNLEWCSGSENLYHAARDGRMFRLDKAKLTEDDVRKIRLRLAAGEYHEDIARAFGVSRTVVTRIKSGTRWRNV